MWRRIPFTAAALLVIRCFAFGADTFTIATWNVRNYLIQPVPGRSAKSEVSRSAVRDCLLQARPDVIAFQEMGGTESLAHLRNELRVRGLDYPEWELVQADDPDIQLGLLSRFPITARRPRTNDVFLVEGRRFQVKRGLLEATIQTGANYQVVILAAHFKSRLPSPLADEAAIRHAEAVQLRARVEAILQADPAANLVVLGDLNDLPGSPALRTVLGRRPALMDARPGELTLEDGRLTPAGSRDAWTYHYPKADAYSRVDYVLLSPGMRPEWVPESSGVIAWPGWREASDHRPVVITVTTGDR